MAHATRMLNRRQFRGLEKLGDAYLPGDEHLPLFSACGCAEHVDVILENLNPEDRDGLVLLLGLLAWVPQPCLVCAIWLLEHAPRLPAWLGGGLRFLRMGLKGVVLTLYYSGHTGAEYGGKSPLESIGYHVEVYTGDLPDTT